MGLLIAGDLVPCANDIELFETGNVKELLGDELYEIWNKSTHKIFNLEAPIINNGHKIDKYGPNLKIFDKCINGINKLNPSLVLLANNHILDYGEKGLNNTFRKLDRNNIDYIGAGENIDSISKYRIFIIDNKKVAIYNTCETEFSIATSNSCGAFGYDEGEIIKDLIALKRKVDYIIIIYHGGKEHYRYPSPGLQKRCRLLTEFGANLIVCQHSHCIGCYEEYNGNTIIYGQGNFIFNANDNEYWNSSLIIDVSFNDKITINYIPIIRQEKGIMIPSDNEYEEILNGYKIRSNEILKEKFIEDNYSLLSENYLNNYMIRLHGLNIIIRVLLKLFGNRIFNIIYNKKDLLAIQNFIECDSHRELMINGIKNEEMKRCKKEN